MRLSRIPHKLAAALVGSLLATAALAHPALVASTPADKAEVAAPANIELKFSETLVPQFSAASLVMTSMPGMSNHGTMKLQVSVTGGADGKTMIITPARALPPGSYRVDWRAVSSDTHPVTGNIAFEVK